MMKKSKKSITELARELRKNATASEQLLWEVLRKRRLNGYRFVRQKPIVYEISQKRKAFFIADFYCPEKKIIIECDGPVHDYQKNYDRQRDQTLFCLGIRTIRIKNDQLGDLSAVEEMILKALESKKL